MLNKEVKHIIFDLDGTLYSLDGGSFGSSSLGKHVKARYLALISGYSITPEDVFENYLRVESMSGIPISENIAKNIGSTRVEVFRRTWGDIDPASVIQGQAINPLFLGFLGQRFGLHILTAGPAIWANKVLEYLHIRDLFQSILTAEEYTGGKIHGFSTLLKENKIAPEQVITFGDQEHTDIQPAETLGIKGVLVKGPIDIYNHLSGLGYDHTSDSKSC